MRFLGVDLAWAEKNPSGGAVLAWDGQCARLERTALLGNDQDVLAFLDREAGAGGCLIAIDAPLTVPNAAGRRPAEAELGRVFSRYQAGAHPTNRVRVGDASGSVRGERLVEALAAHGFRHDPRLSPRAETRQVFEVYPHPAMVSLFGLARTLKYKSKGQDRAALDGAWAGLHAHLGALEGAEPAMTGLAPLLSANVPGLRGRALKNHEDQIDAVFCAYVALHAWYWGPARTEIFGTLDGGYILTPTLPERWQALGG